VLLQAEDGGEQALYVAQTEVAIDVCPDRLGQAFDFLI